MAPAFLRSRFRRQADKPKQPDDSQPSDESKQLEGVEQVDEPEQAERIEQPGESEQPDEVEQAGESERADEVEQAGESERADEVEQAGESERADEVEQAGESERADEVEQPDEPEPVKVPTAEGLEFVSDSEGEWLAYELHAWALEHRVMLRQLLTAEGVIHAWQGTTLLVHFSLEEKIDNLLSEVGLTADNRIKSTDELTAFEMGEWSEELREELFTRLQQDGVAFQLEHTEVVYDLLVRTTDEDRVEMVIDDMLARVTEADLAELDGLELNDLLSSLFVACDQLRRNPHNAEGVLGAVDSARQITAVRTPFGFAAQNWRILRESAGRLLELLESDETTDEELVNRANALRNTLHPLV